MCRNPVSSQRGGGDHLIDLHGLHVNEAIHILKGELTALKSAARAAGERMQVMVCVGTGHHTKGSRTARLPIAVEQFLLDEGLQYTQPQAGLLRVMVY
jgi:DNA-nicking Smr family endonuclease